MVSLFKDRSPASIIWLFILGIIVHSHSFITYVAVEPGQSDGLLSVLLSRYAPRLGAAFIIFLYQAIVFLQALRLNYLFTGHRMYSKVNYLPAMVYILLTGLFSQWSALTPALIDNAAVILLFSQLIRLYNCTNPKSLLFNTGVLIGVSILLYHPSCLLILAAFFALMILRPFIITEWFILVMGVICPYYFLASYLYLTDKIKSFTDYIPNPRFNVPHVHLSLVFFITVAVIFIVLLIGFFYWRVENRRLLIQIRKNWVVLLAMLLVLLPVGFINTNAGLESFVLWIVPASPFIAKGFLGPKRNTLPALMFWVLLALALINNWQLIQ